VASNFPFSGVAVGKLLIGFVPYWSLRARFGRNFPILSEKDVISLELQMLELVCLNQNRAKSVVMRQCSALLGHW
jgi:hypothetical protein